MGTDRNLKAKPKQNRYLADLRDTRFLLWEQLRVEETLLGRPGYAGPDRAAIDATLTRAEVFAMEHMGPEYQASDLESCTLDDEGVVHLPAGYAELWRKYQRDWGQVAAGGDQALPYVAMQSVLELFMGAAPSFMTYGGFCGPSVRLLDEHGTDQQKALFRAPLAASDWAACLCLTEAQAGSDLSRVQTTAVRQDDGTYLVTGEKVFISAGMHDLTGNIVYFVIGRSPEAPSGTVGLSCYIVPRFWVEADGTVAGDNNVRCTELVDKMGFKGCANTRLTFGASGPCRAYLLGGKENHGLKQFLTLMNQARISTGVYALGLASSAYQNALAYAKSRIQGKRFHEAFNAKAPSVPIATHADVQRMLLEMKSKTEGARILIGKLSYFESMAQSLRGGTPEDVKAAERYAGLVSLMTPLVKAYVSDQAWRVAELAIQTHGGIGYTDRHPVEQYARDVKVLAIWEGTNFMQSQDLVRDKLAFGRSSKLMAIYREELQSFLARHADETAFAADLGKLRDAATRLDGMLARFAGWMSEKRLEMIPTYSTRFLEAMAEVTLAWYLLEAAILAARRAAAGDGPESPTFYAGKVASAKWFVANVLPGVETKARIIDAADESATPLDWSVL